TQPKSKPEEILVVDRRKQKQARGATIHTVAESAGSKFRLPIPGLTRRKQMPTVQVDNVQSRETSIPGVKVERPKEARQAPRDDQHPAAPANNNEQAPPDTRLEPKMASGGIRIRVRSGEGLDFGSGVALE